MTLNFLSRRKPLVTVLHGLLLLAILATMLSTIIGFIIASLVESGIDLDLSQTELSTEETTAPEPEMTEQEIKEMLEALEELSKQMTPITTLTVIMYFSLALLFLSIAFSGKEVWGLTLYRYGIGSLLFASCAILSLVMKHRSVYVLLAILHSLALVADHIFAMVKDHRARQISFRAISLLLLALGPVFLNLDNRAFLIYVLILTLPRIFYYIARIAFSQIKLNILQRIIRKTYATEILFGMLLLITAFSIILPKIETGIPSFGDALWYCFAIVTTIGFGDFTAVTIPGRVISVILGIYGIIVVALITSIIINFYNETKGDPEGPEELAEPRDAPKIEGP